MNRCAFLIIAISFALLSCLAIEPMPGANGFRQRTGVVGTPLPSTHLHNLFRVATNVFSGSSPDDDQAFTEIAELGVKTIVSVDGSKPNVEAAHRHSLRYVHLPVGYDGISTNRTAELIRAAKSSAGPLYVHCHHGLHRGPAAVAVMCEATAGWTTNQAVAWLKQAGTSADYAGLYRSAMGFRPPEGAMLEGIVDLPEVARTSSLVEVMVSIDAEFDRLKAAQNAGWAKVDRDLTPAHSATILWEHFRELGRTGDVARRPEDYRARLANAEKVSGQFLSLLRVGKANPGGLDAAFKSLSQSCVGCHKKYRD